MSVNTQVYYVVPHGYDSEMNPVQFSFSGVCEETVFRAPSSPRLLKWIRTAFGTKQMRSQGALGPSVLHRPSKIKIASMVASIFTRNLFERMQIWNSTANLPDLIFVYDVFHKISDLRSFSCPTAYFVGDASVSVDRYFELAQVEDYDYVFVAQSDYIPAFRKRGCKKVFWLPFGFNPEIFDIPQPEFKYDYCFVGRPYSDRMKRLQKVRERCGMFKSFIGHSSDMRATVTLLKQSRAAIQMSVGGVLGQRIFEILAAGPLLVADKVSNGLLDLFKDGEHLVCYSTDHELAEKMVYYLENEEERARIARAGQMEAMTKHTVAHRAKFVLETCLGQRTAAAPLLEVKA